MTPHDILAARQTLGLTQTELALVLGYGAKARIHELEQGARNPSDAVVRLLRLYLLLHKTAPHLLPDDWPHPRRPN